MKSALRVKRAMQIVGIIAGVAIMSSLVYRRVWAAGPAPVKVTVSVTVGTSGGGTLSYQWRSTDGTITNVNAASTTWTLPDGPGLHFAYVLVSNGKGGFTERRVAVNTDVIGNPPVIPPPTTLSPPAAAASQRQLLSLLRHLGIRQVRESRCEDDANPSIPVRCQFRKTLPALQHRLHEPGGSFHDSGSARHQSFLHSMFSRRGCHLHGLLNQRTNDIGCAGSGNHRLCFRNSIDVPPGNFRKPGTGRWQPLWHPERILQRAHHSNRHSSRQRRSKAGRSRETG